MLEVTKKNLFIEQPNDFILLNKIDNMNYKMSFGTIK